MMFFLFFHLNSIRAFLFVGIGQNFLDTYLKAVLATALIVLLLAYAAYWLKLHKTVPLQEADDVFRLPRGWTLTLGGATVTLFIAAALLLFLGSDYRGLTLSEKAALLLIPLAMSVEFLLWFWAFSALWPWPPSRVMFIPAIRYKIWR
jgi:hypothetical protein